MGDAPISDTAEIKQICSLHVKSLRSVLLLPGENVSILFLTVCDSTSFLSSVILMNLELQELSCTKATWLREEVK